VVNFTANIQHIFAISKTVKTNFWIRLIPPNLIQPLLSKGLVLIHEKLTEIHL